MRRREFITLLGGAVAMPAGFSAALAQPPAMPVVGFLAATVAAESAFRVAAFRQGLSEAGFVEGQNVAIEFRWAEGKLDRLPALAADLVQRRAAVIVTQNLTTPAARAATSTIPIVFVIGGDPIASGLVTSLNRPSGNVTGVSFAAALLSAKRLELLHELAPSAAAVAVLMNSGSPSFAVERADVEAAARSIGRQVLIETAVSARDIDAAFATFVRSRAGALLVGSGAFFTGRRRQLAGLATRHALPTIFNLREFVMVGGLMSYGASDTDGYRRGGIYAGRILKGAKPGDLPVEMPSKYELVINLATARAIGVEFPAKLLALADEVIE
jgi:putative ABC transport system substrate-binding protein